MFSAVCFQNGKDSKVYDYYYESREEMEALIGEWFAAGMTDKVYLYENENTWFDVLRPTIKVRLVSEMFPVT
jgi:hypothetical protein